MRILPIFLVYVTSLPAFAMLNWIPETKGNAVYTSQEYCMKYTGQECYSFESTTQDVSVMLVKTKQIDDYSKPLYAARMDDTDCKLYEPKEDDKEWQMPADDCRVLTAIECDGSEVEGDKKCTSKLCKDKTYYSLYAEKKDFGLGEGYFAYCTKVTGYEQQTVKVLEEDATLKAAKEAAIAAELAAQQAKEQEKAQAYAAIEQAKGKVDKMTQAQKDALLEKMIEYITEK